MSYRLFRITFYIIIILLYAGLFKLAGAQAALPLYCYIRPIDQPRYDRKACTDPNATPIQRETWRDGYRFTPGTPTGDLLTIYMFGNSVMFGVLVGDDQTIPYDLQKLIGKRYKVENRALPSENVAGEVADLMTIKLKPGDIVIMLDGVMEIGNCEINRAGIAEYFVRLNTAKGIVRKQGATFYHFLQPTIYSLALRTDERQRIAQIEQSHCPMETLVKQAWPILQAGDVGGDLSRVLDNARLQGKEIYNDWFHPGPLGDRLIALAIYKIVFPAF